MIDRASVGAKRLVRLVIAFALVGIVLTGPADARPYTAASSTLRVVPAAAPIPKPSVTATVGPVVASLESSSYAVPVDDPYSFTTRLAVGEDVDQISVVFRVFRPTGRMMIQRTRIFNQPEAGELTEVFERETSDLDLRPGAYPVSIDVRVSSQGAVTADSVESELLIYDATDKPVPVAFAIRLSGQPMSDPQGRFVADPGRYTRARDDARALAQWVVSEPAARATLAVSPLMLEEWRQVSEGYRLLGPEGATSVPATDAVPVAYGDTLRLLAQAEQTGRLELAALGYSDPDLSDLAEHDLVDDVSVQYARGATTVLAASTAQVSTGTVPAGALLPPSAATPLEQRAIGYAVVQPGSARAGSRKATPGLYQVKGTKLKLLVTDDSLAKTIPTAEKFVETALRRRLDSPGQPVSVRLEIGPGSLETSQVIAAARAIEEQPWARLSTASELAARKATKTATLVARKRSPNPAPDGYWEDVIEGRQWAKAIGASMGGSAARAESAQTSSLIAQCSAWAGPARDWALADRGRAFANNADRLARTLLDKVALKVNSITLPGTEGKVPLTVANDSETTLRVRISAIPSGGLEVAGSPVRAAELLPKDNFIEVPVDLRNAISGRLTVSVYAGPMLLDRQSITVSASYLDRIAIIVGVVLVLLGLLIYVIRRAKASESGMGT